MKRPAQHANSRSPEAQVVLGIAGVGLIGGSIATAAKQRGIATHVIGFGRSAERLNLARRAGLIDEIATDFQACEKVNLFVSCVPIDSIPQSIDSAAQFMPPGSVATDAGSTKQHIVQQLGARPSPNTVFVGAHPLAGSERSGFEFASADLFENRVCVLTPTGNEPDPALDTVRSFWTRLGCQLVTLTPEQHDAILAKTSHLPHVVAAAVASLVEQSDLELSAGGFRDTTRIAGGDPNLWTEILLSNRLHVVSAIKQHVAQCEAFTDAIETGDALRLHSLLQQAKERRDQLRERD